MADSSIRVAWNEGSVADWAARFARQSRATLPQSFAYADAMARTHGYVPRLGLILRGDQPLGMVQVLEKRMLKMFNDRHLHRGPLWFDAAPEAGELEAVFRLLRKACPTNPLNRASVLPELAASPEAAALMERCGFRLIGPGYQTVWLDLTLSEERLRAGFSPQWRKRLRTVEKSALRLDLDPKAQNLPWLMRQEVQQAQAKGFRPLSGPLAVRLRNALLKGDGVLMAAALDGETPVASGFFVRHGGAATYQVGWANEAGRKTDAMRLVLWGAIRALKEQGVQALDLGGINPLTAPGVTEFKTAMGGTTVESVGLYR